MVFCNHFNYFWFGFGWFAWRLLKLNVFVVGLNIRNSQSIQKQDFAPFAIMKAATIHTLNGFGFRYIDILVENRFELCPRKTRLLLCIGFLAPNVEAKNFMNWQAQEKKTNYGSCVLLKEKRVMKIALILQSQLNS